LKVIVARSPVWVKNSFSDRSSANDAAALRGRAEAAMAATEEACATKRATFLDALMAAA